MASLLDSVTLTRVVTRPITASISSTSAVPAVSFARFRDFRGLKASRSLVTQSASTVANRRSRFSLGGRIVCEAQDNTSAVEVSAAANDSQDKQVYIVYMGALPSQEEYTPTSDHVTILQEVTGESSVEGRLVTSYKRSFNGFAAWLTESERERLLKMKGVVSVFPDMMLPTTNDNVLGLLGIKERSEDSKEPDS